jgi:hypothetical protein
MTGLNASRSVVAAEKQEKALQIRMTQNDCDSLSKSVEFLDVLLDQVVSSHVLQCIPEESHDKYANAAVASVMGIQPKGELEGMLAAQLVASHNATTECYRRAALAASHQKAQEYHLNQANKLSRTFVSLLEALNKHRGKGQQKVTVEHVHVHQGGQAIVGHVEQPGGGDKPQLNGSTPCS